MRLTKECAKKLLVAHLRDYGYGNMLVSTVVERVLTEMDKHGLFVGADESLPEIQSLMMQGVIWDANPSQPPAQETFRG